MSASRILLVDDEPAFLRLAGAWLKAQGYETITADSATAARERFAAVKPHLVLLDLVMPPERTPEAGPGPHPRIPGRAGDRHDGACGARACLARGGGGRVGLPCQAGRAGAC